MGNKQVKLGLRLDDKKFIAGSLVTGRVYLSVKQEVHALGLYLLLQGEECSQIAHDEQDHSHSSGRDYSITHREIDRASSSLVHMNVALSSFPSAKLMPGQYEYPFQWELPSNLPGTMYCAKGDSHCEIRYRMTAYLRRSESFGEPEHTATQAVCIIAQPKPLQHSTGLVVDPEVVRIKNCCFDSGQVTLGWDVDKTVVSPDSILKIGIYGRNESSVQVDCLRARLVETITWQAHGRRKEEKSVLTEAIVSTISLPYWHSTTQFHHAHPYQHVDMGSYRQSVVETQISLPREARDTYSGTIVQVRHSLVISAKTPPCHTTVESGILVRIQRQSTEVTSQATTAVQAHGPTFVQADILPEDWSPQEAQVVTLPVSSAVLLDKEYTPPILSAPDQTNGMTSSATAPDESLLTGYGPQTTNMTSCLSNLLGSLAYNNDPVSFVSHGLIDPMMATTIQNLSPRQYVQVLQTANRDLPKLARLLAGAMGDSFQCRHVLACVWTLSPQIRMDVLKEVAPLASDLDTQRDMVERELDEQELLHFRAALK